MSDLAAAYWRVKRPCKEGSLAEAIRTHSQACGLIAFVFDVHPDHVAEQVKASVDRRSRDAAAKKARR